MVNATVTEVEAPNGRFAGIRPISSIRQNVPTKGGFARVSGTSKLHLAFRERRKCSIYFDFSQGSTCVFDGGDDAICRWDYLYWNNIYCNAKLDVFIQPQRVSKNRSAARRLLKRSRFRADQAYRAAVSNVLERKRSKAKSPLQGNEHGSALFVSYNYSLGVRFGFVDLANSPSNTPPPSQTPPPYRPDGNDNEKRDGK